MTPFEFLFEWIHGAIAKSLGSFKQFSFCQVGHDDVVRGSCADRKGDGYDLCYESINRSSYGHYGHYNESFIDDGGMTRLKNPYENSIWLDHGTFLGQAIWHSVHPFDENSSS